MTKPESHQTEYEAVAIIGMAGRFPGASSLSAFWRNLRTGAEAVQTFSDRELRDAGVPPETLENSNYVKTGAPLYGVDLFDAGFFGFSPQDAAILDPQHRHFFECAWEALEDAGHTQESFDGSIAVYAGSGMNTYLIYNLLADAQLVESAGVFRLRQTGNDKDILASRVSYQMDLHGPSVNVQTACSTSLVAVHMACQSLLNRECDMALAGGVTIEIPHRRGYMYRPGEIQSRDGHCRPFDASATGTVFGNGAGIVVLRRLGDAVRNGDCIRAVITGSAVNNDGKRKVSYHAPSVDGQADVVAEALAMAGVSADDISYVEAHGSGTSVGDPIEIRALTQAFRKTTARNQYCAVGSLKGNIGHLDTAAGVAGLIKTILALQHREIPPSIHFEKPNPAIEFSDSPFFVNTQLREWSDDGGPRRAGVTSLGVGGTNAHVILEEAPATSPTPPGRPYEILVLSAKSAEALQTATENLAAHLRNEPSLSAADVAFTLQLGRKAFPHRRMLVVRDVADAVKVLTGQDATRMFTHHRKVDDPGVVFLFSGQGAQYPGMGREWYDSEPVFRNEIDLCARLLRPHVGFDLRTVLYPSGNADGSGEAELDQTWITQPALFVTEYALAKLWMSWGVRPASMIGHSIGEYVAACLAGVFRLEDALSLVVARGRLMQSLPAGAMVAVPLPESEVCRLLGPDLSLAASNGPSQCVVSGPVHAVEGFEARLNEQEIAFKRLRTSHAFHSSMLDPVLESFAERVAKLRLSPPQTPFLSNVTGAWITPEQAVDPGYWSVHMRSTVRFSEALEVIFQKPQAVLLEVGPGQTLTNLARRHPLRPPTHEAISSSPRAQSGDSELRHLLGTLGQLWLNGAPVQWTGFRSSHPGRRVPLPTYPFRRLRYWIEPGQPAVLGEAPEAKPAEASEFDDGLYQPVSAAKEIESAPAAGDIETALAEWWGELLGVEQVGLEDNFFDLGGHSLIAVRLFAKIKKTFRVELGFARLFEAPTIAQLASIIRSHGTSTLEESPSARLITIQPNGSRTPFYFVSGIGGSVLSFETLARYLGPDQPVYALQPQGVDGKAPLLTTIEEMASYYIHEIRSIQPHGPYYLAGYSFGGYVTFEMAHQLRAEGDEVALLALLDTIEWHYHQRCHRSLNVKDKLELLRGRMQRLISGPDRMDYIWNRIHQTRLQISYLASDVFGRRLHRASEVVEYVNRKAAALYQPRQYPGRLTLFRCSERSVLDGTDNLLGWGHLAAGGVEVHEVPGNHLVLMKEPNVRFVAQALIACVNRFAFMPSH